MIKNMINGNKKQKEIRKTNNRKKEICNKFTVKKENDTKKSKPRFSKLWYINNLENQIYWLKSFKVFRRFLIIENENKLLESFIRKLKIKPQGFYKLINKKLIEYAKEHNVFDSFF